MDETRKSVRAAKLLTCIRQVAGSYLDWDTRHSGPSVPSFLIQPLNFEHNSGLVVNFVNRFKVKILQLHLKTEFNTLIIYKDPVRTAQ
jgi:hypothetical protein